MMGGRLHFSTKHEMLTSGEILPFSGLILWENFGGNRIVGQRKKTNTNEKHENFWRGIQKIAVPIVVGAGSHARPIRRSLKTERNWDKIFERQYFRRQHGTTKDNLGQLYYFID